MKRLYLRLASRLISNITLKMLYRYDIGQCLLDLKKFKEALKILKEVAEVEKKNEHDQYLETRKTIAQCLIESGKPKEALEILKEIKIIRKEKLGEKHPNYLAVLSDEAACLVQMGKSAEALEIYKGIDKIQMEKPSKYPLHLETKLSITNCLINLERFEGALPVLEEIETAHKEKFGTNTHPFLLKIKFNRALCWIKTERAAEGLKMLEIVERLGGPKTWWTQVEDIL